MVEGQGAAAVAGVGDHGPPRVVASPGAARRPGQEDRGDGMEARVPGRVRVGPELAEELDVETRLLPRLPDGGRLERLAVVDEAAGQGPARRGIAALDEDDPPPAAVPHLDDDVDGGEGVAVLAAGHGGSGFRAHCRGPAPAVSTADMRTLPRAAAAAGTSTFSGLAAASSSIGDSLCPAAPVLQAGALA